VAQPLDSVDRRTYREILGIQSLAGGTSCVASGTRWRIRGTHRQPRPLLAGVRPHRPTLAHPPGRVASRSVRLHRVAACTSVLVLGRVSVTGASRAVPRSRSALIEHAPAAQRGQHSAFVGVLAFLERLSSEEFTGLYDLSYLICPLRASSFTRRSDLCEILVQKSEKLPMAPRHRDRGPRVENSLASEKPGKPGQTRTELKGESHLRARRGTASP
jgi:hypothetical protein